MNLPKKNQMVFVSRKIDMTKTGGPIIPEFAHAKVLKRHRDNTVWLEFQDQKIADECGRRRLLVSDLQW